MLEDFERRLFPIHSNIIASSGQDWWQAKAKERLKGVEPPPPPPIWLWNQMKPPRSDEFKVLTAMESSALKWKGFTLLPLFLRSVRVWIDWSSPHFAFLARWSGNNPKLKVLHFLAFIVCKLSLLQTRLTLKSDPEARFFPFFFFVFLLEHRSGRVERKKDNAVSRMPVFLKSVIHTKIIQSEIIQEAIEDATVLNDKLSNLMVPAQAW